MKRYDGFVDIEMGGYVVEMCEIQDGEYVKYSDVEILLAELEELKKENKLLLDECCKLRAEINKK